MGTFQHWCIRQLLVPKIVNEYDQEIPQSQTADNPMVPRGRAAQPSRLCCKSTIKSNVNGRQFSVITSSDLD